MSKKKMFFGNSHPSFEFTIKTDNLSTGSSLNNQFKLPLIALGGIDFRVDWGDNSSSFITAWNQTEVTHTYATIGTYLISITGTIRGFVFNNTGDRLKFLNVSKVSGLILNSSEAFWGCSNMTWTTLESPVIEIANIQNLFRECTNFNGNINNWNVSGVTSFNNTFRGCTNFNSPLNNWNVSSGDNFQQTFQDCPNFNQDITGWNVGNVTTMLGMFNRATNFNQNIGSWDVSKVTTMNVMFQSATNFNQNIGSWDVSKVANFGDFMSNKTSLNFSASNYDAILNGWSSRAVKPNLTLNMGTIKYTASGTAGKAILTSSPNNWTITDGGI